MRKWVRVLALSMAAVLTLMFAGCQKEEDATSGATKGIAQDKIKVGVIHLSDPAEGSGYSFTHDQGIVAMQKELKLRDDQIVRKNKVDDQDPTAIERAIRDCIEDGCNIIFGTSWGYMDTMESLAKEYRRSFSATAPAIRKTTPTSATISVVSIRPGI